MSSRPPVGRNTDLSRMKDDSRTPGLLEGRWVSADPLLDQIEHHVRVENGEYRVSVTDSTDGEHAEVYDVRWDGERLSYCTHWASTGRFAKNSLTALGDDKLRLTYTYTAQEVLVRSPDEVAGEEHA